MFREELMSALKQAVTHYNGGMDDNGAVVKAASDNDFNTDQTQRLLEVYNTTKTICFFKTADDRTVSFSTADPEKVATSLFSPEALKREKAESKGTKQAVFDYSEYEQPEHDYTTEESMNITPIKSAEYFDQDMDTLARRANTQIRTMRKTAENCQSTADMCTVKYQDILTKIARSMQQNYHAPNKFEDGLQFFKIAHGEQAQAVIGDLLGFLPKNYQEKKASTHMLSTYDTEHASDTSLFKQAVDYKLDYAELKACELQFTEMAKEAEAEFKEACGETPPAEQEPDFFAVGLQEKLAKSTYKGTSAYSALTDAANPLNPGEPTEKTTTNEINPVGDIFGMAVKGVGEGTRKSLESGVAKVLTAPKKRESQRIGDRMRNLQRQLIMEDLISNDPVLQGVDANQITNGYQTILQLAPEVSLNKEVVRSILRASTNAEATSPFDAKLMAELETQIKKQTELPGRDKKD